MYNDVGLDLCKIIITFIFPLFVCVILVVWLRDYKAESKVIEAVYAGEIIDKKIENARQGLFSSSDMQYRIYIEFEYTHDDETQTGEKYFTVDKETYLAYDIGDWFDSHDFEYVEVEEG